MIKILKTSIMINKTCVSNVHDCSRVVDTVQAGVGDSLTLFTLNSSNLNNNTNQN